MVIWAMMRECHHCHHQTRGGGENNGRREVKDKDNFVKIIFWFYESLAKLLHQLKKHVRCAMSTSIVNALFTYMLILLTVGA